MAAMFILVIEVGWVGKREGEEVLTSADEEPVRVGGRESPVNASLDKVDPLGELDVSALLQVLSVGIDEIRGRDVLH